VCDYSDSTAGSVLFLTVLMALLSNPSLLQFLHVFHVIYSGENISWLFVNGFQDSLPGNWKIMPYVLRYCVQLRNVCYFQEMQEMTLQNTRFLFPRSLS